MQTSRGKIKELEVLSEDRRTVTTDQGEVFELWAYSTAETGTDGYFYTQEQGYLLKPLHIHDPMELHTYTKPPVTYYRCRICNREMAIKPAPPKQEVEE